MRERRVCIRPLKRLDAAARSRKTGEDTRIRRGRTARRCSDISPRAMVARRQQRPCKSPLRRRDILAHAGESAEAWRHMGIRAAALFRARTWAEWLQAPCWAGKSQGTSSSTLSSKVPRVHGSSQPRSDRMRKRTIPRNRNAKRARHYSHGDGRWEIFCLFAARRLGFRLGLPESRVRPALSRSWDPRRGKRR
ncbi:hypothetical protein PYCCODRAFT_617351 [Trametes coccinea BRFM310]|uniref:Uncharacterized protein n=1 Tax=Trametes coccinea (strain BRFM310) TaxID=1353009 RepID=A0A1Y2J265_TRAC3|nr:hypothetical protein PYCCODRAFT_617351 [Trametes coccinea BRFM310]